jgi:hypothetical protein
MNLIVVSRNAFINLISTCKNNRKIEFAFYPVPVKAQSETIGLIDFWKINKAFV